MDREPLQGNVEKNHGGGFWARVGDTIGNVAGHIGDAVSQVDWADVANDLNAYQQQFAQPHINDYASWKTGQIHEHVPGELDGWEFDEHYQGRRPDSRLLYVDASGTLSQPLKYVSRIGGHVALEVDGKVYSYDPEGLHIEPARNYIHHITHRQKGQGPQTVWAYPLGLSNTEKQQAVREMESLIGQDYNLSERQCALCTINALQNSTRDSYSPIVQTRMPADDSIEYITGRLNIQNYGAIDPYTPADVIQDVRLSERLYGPRFIYQPPKPLRAWDNKLPGLQ